MVGSSTPLNILLHDYCGHPFQYQLARELAGRGHTVEHLYCGSNPTTPSGIHDGGSISGSLRSRAIELPRPIAKGDFLSRWSLERQYGKALAAAIAASSPDIVVLANTPIDSLVGAMGVVRREGLPVLIWVQDLLGEAALRVLPDKIGFPGKLIGHIYRRREWRLLARADHLIAITEDFAPAFDRAGIARSNWSVVPNWGPLDRIFPREKSNSWSIEQGLSDKIVLLYSGNLGFKHNPGLLLSLARALRHRENVVVVVNSEGAAANWLAQAAADEDLQSTLRVNGFQPFERISEVLAAADILLAVLEPGAGVFSVPSKVLSNLCAGRAQVLALPSDNLAARIVLESGAGVVCDPESQDEFVAAALALVDDGVTRIAMGQAARRHAEQNFRIDRIAGEFEVAFEKAISAKREAAV